MTRHTTASAAIHAARAADIATYCPTRVLAPRVDPSVIEHDAPALLELIREHEAQWLIHVATRVHREHGRDGVTSALVAGVQVRAIAR